MQDQMKFHLSLNVTDIQKTITFYTNLFGNQPVKIEPDYAKFELDNPGLVISFVQRAEQAQPGFGHLGFRVADDEVLAERKKALSEFMEIKLEEEQTNCCYAIQNKFWVEDPDGYEWEVYHLIEDAKSDKQKAQSHTCC